MRLAAEARRRKRRAAYVWQTIIIGTNLGYSLAVASVVDLAWTRTPRITTDAFLFGFGFTMLAMTLIFAPQGEA